MSDKLDVKKYAHLARVKLTAQEIKKFGKDLGDILDHFRELQEVKTDNVEPMTGGTNIINRFREDVAGAKEHRVSGGGEQFPKSESGYLKVPKVFD